MNALSESITAVFSCVTDIISLILLNCFGISCVNEHNGTGGKKAYTNCEQTLQLFMGSGSPLEKEEGMSGSDLLARHAFWICNAKNSM